MTDGEFQAWLDDEVENGRMTPEQRRDLLDQKQLFDKNLPADNTAIRKELHGQIVGYVAGDFLRNSKLHALLNEAKSTHPDRMVYFEPIGFDLF